MQDDNIILVKFIMDNRFWFYYIYTKILKNTYPALIDQLNKIV